MEKTNLPWLKLSKISDTEKDVFLKEAQEDINDFSTENEKNVGYYKTVVSSIYSYWGKTAPTVLLDNCDKFHQTKIDDFIAYWLYIDLDKFQIYINIVNIEDFDEDIVDKYNLSNREYKEDEYGEDKGTIYFNEDIFDSIMEDIIAYSIFVPIFIIKRDLNHTHRYKLINHYATMATNFTDEIVANDPYLLAERTAYNNLLNWIDTLDYKPNPDARYYIDCRPLKSGSNCREDIKCKLRRYKDNEQSGK